MLELKQQLQSVLGEAMAQNIFNTNNYSRQAVFCQLSALGHLVEQMPDPSPLDEDISLGLEINQLVQEE